MTGTDDIADAGLAAFDQEHEPIGSEAGGPDAFGVAVGSEPPEQEPPVRVDPTAPGAPSAPEAPLGPPPMAPEWPADPTPPPGG